MHARVAGQRAVVEVDRGPLRQSDGLLREHAHIGDAEEIIKCPALERGHHIFRWVQQPHTPFSGPLNDLGI